MGAVSAAGGGRALVVCSTAALVGAARASQLDSVVICTGPLSSAFGLAPAPSIDVPANGGKFVEPGRDTWLKALGKIEPPTMGMACFSFSAMFFFRHFAERRARALRAHSAR